MQPLSLRKLAVRFLSNYLQWTIYHVLSFLESACLKGGSEFQPMVDYAKVSFFDADSTEQDNHFGMRGVFLFSNGLFF